MPTPVRASSRLRAGEFEVDLRCGEVRRNGEKIRLQQRPFQILVALMQHPGEVVTREELRQNLWPDDTFVDFEHGINTGVKKLREALGDDAESPRFIETLPRYGYRFIPPVEIVESNGLSAEAGTPATQLPEKDEKPAPKRRWPGVAVAAAAGLIALIIVGSGAVFLALRWQRSKSSGSGAWEQITKFSDSATQPALSPDGRMIAFIRGPETFVTPGQIYVKILPDGEPVQLTHDNLPKMAPVFSPDGSRIAYTATDRSSDWDTWVVPVLGGEPRKLMPNAAGLTWLDREHVLFSETGPPDESMAIVRATESRAEERKVYVPITWGMAHRSWASPDGKWVLLSEMDSGGWMPCRVVPFDGSSRGHTVGPNPARCTYAGWSPDGETMYFSAEAGDGFHIWRQHFPDGRPEQLTFGATEEEGTAIAADGRSLVTSAGIKESTVWVHDARGDRQISGEGFASLPGLGYGSEKFRSVFSPDGKKLFYLIRKPSSREWTSGELWSTDLDSGESAAVLPGILIDGIFDISPDGKRVTFQTADANGDRHVWVASLDRHSPPQLVTPSIASNPGFGPGGSIYFVVPHGDRWILSGAASEGSQAVLDFKSRYVFEGISPSGNWRLAGTAPALAYPTQQGPPTLICKFCSAGWGPGGGFFYVRFRGVGEMGGGRTIAIGLPPGKELPTLPPAGLNSIEDAKGLNIAAEIDMSDKTLFAPGPDPTVYAYTRVTVQRNLYRIRLK
jgi:DNA-binding winged helix-turn-helix (wHTH) protein/Tol biopolymer transport system component